LRRRTRSHGVQAGLDPGARVVDATVADNLFMAELSAWFSRRLATNALEGDPIVVLAEEIPLQVVDLVRELAILRRKHPDAQRISPPLNVRPDITFVQAVDDFDRWRASVGHDTWGREIAHELRRSGLRHQRSGFRAAVAALRSGIRPAVCAEGIAAQDI
jgi:CRISPR-associated exonuclease Cas4